MGTALNLTEVNAALREGDTGRALQIFKTILEKSGEYTAAVRAVRVLEAQFANTRRQEILSTLSFAESQREYNKINDALAALMENPSVVNIAWLPTSTPIWQRRGFFFVVATVLAAVAVAAYFLFFKENVCPDFEDKKLKIMLLPFQKVSGADARPEVVFQNRILNLTQKFNISADAKVAPAVPKREPQGLSEAGKLGKSCGADFLIWGQYSSGRDSVRVNLQYVFCQTGQVGGESLAGVDLLDFQSGQMTKSLNDAIFSFCGMLAVREKRWDVAERWLEKVQEKDATDARMLKMIEDKKR